MLGIKVPKGFFVQAERKAVQKNKILFLSEVAKTLREQKECGNRRQSNRFF